MGNQSEYLAEFEAKLSESALELLALPKDDAPRLLLDIGCGSGLSGETFCAKGHQWIGVDISASMLNVGVEREVEGDDLLLGDMAQVLGLQSGVIADGAISITALQWLCNADKSSSHEPRLRLKAFFGSLYQCLSRGARVVFQMYPEDNDQREMIAGEAAKAGFGASLFTDFPHCAKNKRELLVVRRGPPFLRSKCNNEGEEGCSCSHHPKRRPFRRSTRNRRFYRFGN